MEVYLQGPGGEEWELTISEPDPSDGTYTVDVGELRRLLEAAPEGSWLRVVP